MRLKILGREGTHAIFDYSFSFRMHKIVFFSRKIEKGNILTSPVNLVKVGLS